MSFWGPKMMQLLEECNMRRVEWRSLSPRQFGIEMNKLTKSQVDLHQYPEICADQWLNALERNEKKQTR